MLEKQLAYIRNKTDFVPETAIVLGSGLGEILDDIEKVITIPFSEIENFPVSTNSMHKGSFIFGYYQGKKVAVMDGRVHIYEGYTPEETVMPLRLLRLMGCEKIIFTNASGGINKNFSVGDIMMITDHVSVFVQSPLIGKNDDRLGPRFPDMSNVYDKNIYSKVKLSAKANGIELKSGVYAQLTGPQFETPAEIKLLSTLGVDAVGMSTVTEAIAAKHCGYQVCAYSLITNLACGICDKPLTSDEVIETAEKTKDKIRSIIDETVRIF